MVVALVRDVDVAEDVHEFAGLRAGPAEVPVEEDSHVGSVEAPGGRPGAVTGLVRIRLAAVRQRTVGMAPVKAQRMDEQGARGAHRRVADSILSIMAAIVPSRARFGKRWRPGSVPGRRRCQRGISPATAADQRR
ncbi:hypothetical protein Aph02nite_25030 [Actinoplanes philippinensis]|nr:hypothetical protein Aph02nite_25030 [Actinoplanes philippinensis]